MRLLVDSHTHTVVSGHAYSTLFENLEFAFSKGLEGIVMSEHAERLPGAQPNLALRPQTAFPREYKGVRLIRGIELNILNSRGEVDMQERHLKLAQFAIASFHEVVFRGGTQRENTDAMIGALNNPYIDIIGHPGNPNFPIDQEAVVLEAKKLGKLLEVNNHSFYFRKGSEDNCRKLIGLCKKHEVRISVGSDAHICLKVGSFDHAIAALTQEEFPEELIISRNIEAFDAYLSEKEERICRLSGA